MLLVLCLTAVVLSGRGGSRGRISRSRISRSRTNNDYNGGSSLHWKTILLIGGGLFGGIGIIWCMCRCCKEESTVPANNHIRPHVANTEAEPEPQIVKMEPPTYHAPPTYPALGEGYTNSSFSPQVGETPYPPQDNCPYATSGAYPAPGANPSAPPGAYPAPGTNPYASSGAYSAAADPLPHYPG